MKTRKIQTLLVVALLIAIAIILLYPVGNRMLQMIRTGSHAYGPSLIAAPTSTPLSLPFEETLNSSSSGWIKWGDVQFTNQGVSIMGENNSPGNGIFLKNSQSWTDYALDANLDWNLNDTITLNARYIDSNNRESCTFSKSGVQIFESSGASAAQKQLFQGDDLIASTTVDLGVRVIKDKIECLVNGNVVAYTYGADPSLAAGGIGISTWSGAARNVSVLLHSVSVSTFDNPQEYTQTYNLNTATSSAPQTHPAPVLTETPAGPAGTSLQNLGSPAVFANWTARNQSTLVADTSLHTEGTQSLSLTTDGAGDFADALVLNQGPYNLTNKYLEIWIRVSSTTNIGELYFRASSDNMNADYYVWQLNSQVHSSSDESEIQAGEWVPIVLTFDADDEHTEVIGTPNIAALNSFDLHISDDGSVPLTVWLGGISAVAEPPQGALSIVFDNGWTSEYTLAMPTLAKYGFPAVIAEIPQTANDPAFMSTQQLQDVQNNMGWDIACHTWDHVYQLGLPTTTIAVMDSEFTQCKNWLVKNGLGKASNILVWPNGSNSPEAIAEASKYFVAARGIVGDVFNTLPVANPMMLYATEFGGDTPTSTLDADVDRCMANHEWCIFYGHIITTSTPENQDQYASSSFNDFIAHIAQVGIPVRTITDVLANEPDLPAPSEASLQSPTSTIISAITNTNTPTSTSDESMPFTQGNFAENSNWQSTWGTKNVSSSTFILLAANALTSGASTILANTENWTDYQFNTTFDWTKGQEVGLIGRYVDDKNYLSCEFEDTSQFGEGGVTMKLVQDINGHQETLETGGAPNYKGIGANGIKAYIRVYGPYATCSFNGQTLPEYDMTIYPPPMDGGIGFTIWDPSLDNSGIVVKNVDVEPVYYYQP